MQQSTIVVGVDGSEESRAALRFALDDAVRRGARVRVIRAFEPPEYWAMAYGLSSPPSIASIRENMEADTREIVEDTVRGDAALAEVPIEVTAVPGQPGRVVAEEAAGADLLVLGHRGRGAVSSALLGSVGLHCVLHAPCPVTVVRPPAARQSAAERAVAEPAPA